METLGSCVRGRAVVFVLPAFACMSLPLVAAASDPDETHVVRVEEDWALELLEPDGNVTAPQINTVMSPFGDGSVVFQVNWNYWDMPSFQPGGIQVQAWQGKSLAAQKGFGEASLSLDAETVTWTQVMEANGDSVSFSVVNGRSETWGDFGGENMTVDVATPAANLDAYSPAASRADATVTFGLNRVAVLRMTGVRVYGPDGPLAESSEAVDVVTAQ